MQQPLNNNNNKSSEKTSDAAAHAFYDLAYCYLLNGEFLRCVELLENNELVYSSLKFRIITGQALLKAGNTQACIRVLEKDPSNTEDDSVQIGPMSEQTPDQRMTTSKEGS